jgi:hypothetical protein
MQPPILGVEWREDYGRGPSDVSIHPPQQGEGRLVNPLVPPQMRPPVYLPARQLTVSPLRTPGSLEYGPYPPARRISPPAEEQPTYERSGAQAALGTSSGHLGIRAENVIHDSEELSDNLTDVFSRVEGNRLNTATLLNSVFSRFGDRLSPAERECHRIFFSFLLKHCH